MIDLVNPVLGYMVCTLVLGTILGWAVWGFGSSKKHQSLASEAEFWEANLNQARRERDINLTEIESLKEEKANLKKRLKAQDKTEDKT
ncbi:MAG: hypothetical protein ABJN14_09175 [Paracoccaceae bacterium]